MMVRSLPPPPVADLPAAKHVHGEMGLETDVVTGAPAMLS